MRLGIDGESTGVFDPLLSDGAVEERLPHVGVDKQLVKLVEELVLVLKALEEKLRESRGERSEGEGSEAGQR